MAQGLETVQVLEVGSGVAIAAAGKMMADLGATVVKVEPPEGVAERCSPPFPQGEANPETGGLHLYLNANKRSLVLDLTQPAGQDALAALVPRCDILIHGFSPREMARHGMHHTRLADLHPGLVMLAVTPFGLSGPYNEYVGSDLTLVHGGGWGWICPAPGTDPARPPLKPFGHHGLVQGGLHGALAALAAHFGTLRGAPGDVVDTSIQEVNAGYLGRAILNNSYLGRVDSRLTKRWLAPSGFYRTADGQILIICVEEDQWQRLVELMEYPEWTTREAFKTRESRGEHAEEFKPLLEAWTSQWKAEELYRVCQARKIGTGPILTTEQLLHQEHLQARGFPVPLEHPVAGRLTMPGAPYVPRDGWWALRRAAPLLGEANGDAAALFAPRPAGAPVAGGSILALPLAGVRVLDFSWVWAGPYATMHLAHLGAEVIKVESAHRLDHARRVQVYPPGMEGNVNRSGYFNEWNQGKKSITVNLGEQEGRELIKGLLPHFDAVVSNYGAGVIERMGLGPDVMHAINPNLIIAAISGFGQTGPDTKYTAYGSAVVPLAGISASTGYENDGGRAQEVGTAYGDPVAGIYTAYAVMAGLVAREKFGGGQVFDVSMWEAMIATGFEGWMNAVLGNAPYQPMGNHDPYHAPCNLYACTGDDKWVALTCTSDTQWRALCGVLGRPEMADDPRYATAAARKANETELDRLLSDWCGARDRWEVTRSLQAVGVPAFPSLSSQDLMDDEHLIARAYFTRLPHPEVGTRTHVGIPWRFTRRPNGVRSPAPVLGAHTDEVLIGLVGMSEAEVAALRERNILR